jgi:hypothetical protein
MLTLPIFYLLGYYSLESHLEKDKVNYGGGSEQADFNERPVAGYCLIP